MRILNSLLLAGLVAACAARSASTSGPTTAKPDEPVRETPQHEATVPDATLASPLLVARVEAGLQLLEDQLREWSFDAGDVPPPCVLAFDEERQWLFGCSRAPDFLTELPQRALGQPVFTASPSLTLSGQVLAFEAVKLNLVATVGTLAVEGSDEGPAATQKVFLVQTLESLRRHHPGFTTSDADEWLAILVHEHFHSFQLSDRRVLAAMGDLRALNPEALATFGGKPEVRGAIEKEFAVLRDAVAKGPDANEASRALASWLELRAERIRTFAAEFEKEHPGAPYEKQDALFTFIEGTARHAEVKALVQSTASLEALGDDPLFNGFDTTRGKPVYELAGLGGLNRKYFYSLGLYASLLLDVAAPGWQKQALEHPELLVGVASELVR